MFPLLVTSPSLTLNSMWGGGGVAFIDETTLEGAALERADV